MYPKRGALSLNLHYKSTSFEPYAMTELSNLTLEQRPLHGWPNTLVLANPILRLHITTDVGPRIIHCGPTDEQNLFFISPNHAGKTGGKNWRLYGGHRLWHAPEDKVRTYVPDNEPVPHTWDGYRLTLSSPTESITGLRKTVRIELHPTEPNVKIVHTLTNDGKVPVSTAAWALTVLRPNGKAILPNEPLGVFPQDLLPARPLVLWPYTRLNDPRFKFTDEHMEISQIAGLPQPVKVGIRNSLNWAAYYNDGFCFLKQCNLDTAATYPDFNSNWEVYTDSNMLELETLSPVTELAPGNRLEHVESWQVLACANESDLWKIIQSALQNP